MPLDPTSLRRSLKKAVVAIGGVRAAEHANVIKTRLFPPSLPTPERPWTEPAEPGQLPVIQTEHGPVRIVPPRGEVEPGTGRYPGPPGGPKPPRSRRVLPGSELQFYPHCHLPEHPTRWEFPAYLDNPNCRWLQEVKRLNAEKIAFPSSLAPEAALLVHSLIRNIRPRVVIETGTYIGMSTIWIAGALQANGDGGVVHTFDDFSPILPGPWRDVGMPTGRMQFVAENIARAGVAEHVVIHPGNSSFEIKAAHADLAAAGGVQLAFLDADHGVVGVWHDLWATEPVLNTGGFVLVHDTFPEYCANDGPRHLLDHLNEKAVGTYEKIDMYLSPMNYGLGIIRRVG